MATHNKTENRTHSERTKDSYRSKGIYYVTVTNISELSPTVRGYVLSTQQHCRSTSDSTCDDSETTPTFKAGQWLDVYVPDENDAIIGGYSLTCCPNQSDHLSLAIQYSTHKPTHWMYMKCQIGNQLKIKVGGDFYYDPTPSLPFNLLLIAGGIGINPIYSIFGHQYNLLSLYRKEQHNPRTYLLYSARNTQELIFKDNIIDWCQNLPDLFSVKFFVTREKNSTLLRKLDFQERRINSDDLHGVFNFLPLQETHCYLCGPPPFINQMTSQLVNYIGMNEEYIHYEKWW